ncbi:ER degradation-enhancing alpha-mannosidase-like protein 2 [Bulinus truncatus]|nr:ER degradation-enhancing alpha-mannosidase-like protein 2 [Bulinus truncatus]
MALMFTMLMKVSTLLVLLTVLNCLYFSNAGRLGEIDINVYREKVKQMFYHAYEGYLKHAYPYDELQPLTCKGHDTWGSYSLTLIDAMDTLAVMGNYSEFRRIAQILIDKGESFFDIDINASVFETNIRIVGGLLSGHLLMKRAGMVLEPAWPCSGPLLRMAENVARRILPAFDTPTGMPYGTVNLRYGVPKGETTVTCTAGVGTFVVEFGTLSRLTGDPVFEKAAIRAIRALWKFRSTLGLLGNHIDVSNGKWTALDSGIGGGIDSYFEYLVKGSMMFNIPELLHMFREYEVPIRKYLKRGDWYMWAQMNKGSVTLPLFTSLDAYWPGIQTLLGDLDDAMKTIHNFHQVWRQFGFTPEYYNIPKAEVHQGREGYPLRPEIIESVMYLYKATKDPYLLEIGVDIVETIEHSARTACGYATIKDVRDHQLEDRMESFFLAETTKYLYLLFDPDNFIHNNGSHGDVINTPSGSCVIEAGGYVFNTEAHPIDLAAVHCCSAEKKEEDRLLQDFHNNLDMISLLNIVDEFDDGSWSLKKTKQVKLKKAQYTEEPVDIGDIINVVGPVAVENKQNEAAVDETHYAGGHIPDESSSSACTDKMEQNDEAEGLDIKSDSKHPLEVIDMTIFTERERNLTHLFMQEQQIKSLLKNLSSHLANQMREQYRATVFEQLANEVAGKILKAGDDPVALSADVSENSSVSASEGDSNFNGKDVAENNERNKEKVDGTENIDSSKETNQEKNEAQYGNDDAQKDLEKGAVSDVNSQAETKLIVTENILGMHSEVLGQIKKDSGNVDSDVDLGSVQINTKKSNLLTEDGANLPASSGSLDSQQEHSTDSLGQQGLTSGTTIQHKISINGESKIIVVHLQKNNKEDTASGEPTQTTEDPQAEVITSGDESTKTADLTAERFKNHIDLQIQTHDSGQKSSEEGPLSASPPGEKGQSSLENKRSNLLTLTTKLLNIFSGNEKEAEKTESEVEARVPSLAGLYSSLANYTVRYFHDPAILHCSAQTFQSRISVYGEVFPED